MRYVFIINPNTHAAKLEEKINENIKKIFSSSDCEYKIVKTKCVGDATEITKSEASIGDELRIYGFGGDGTLSEIAEAAKGHENVEIGIFPLGSGNDYIRNYGTIKEFLNFKDQIEGESITVDMIETLHSSSINICSVGFDAQVGYRMKHYKNLPFVDGPMSYNVAVVRSFMGKLGQELTIKIHDDSGISTVSGSFLFALAASGKCYGGGYLGAPSALTNDGLLDFVLIKSVPRHKFFSLVKLYKKGLHLESDVFKDYLIFKRGKKIEIEGADKLYCSRDGECNMVDREIFTLSDKKLKFILPFSVKYKN